MPLEDPVSHSRGTSSDESVATSHQENEDQMAKKINPIILEFEPNLKELRWSKVFTKR